MILSTTHKDAASAFAAATLVAAENDEDATVTTTTSSFKDKYGIIPPPPLPDHSHHSNLSPKSSLLSTVGGDSGSSSSHAHHHVMHKRPLVLFSIDITHWPSIVQFVILVGGLIVFMCLYGYYQELVIYGWFNRKLSLSSTFLHFLGCSVFAQLQRHVTNPNASLSIPGPTPHSHNGHVHDHGTVSHSFFWWLSPVAWYQLVICWTGQEPHHHYQQQQQQKWWQQFLRVGTAPPRIALFYITVLVLTKTFAQGLSNLSMSQMNYPAKVLFKSANPIVTMIIGVVWLKRVYPLRDYFVVVLLIAGLYIFITDNSAVFGTTLKANTAATTLPESTPLGIVYVVLSMIGSAGVPMIQEYCITMYHASVEDLIYWSFVGSAIISGLLAIVMGEFGQGLIFVVQSTNGHILHTLWIFFAFCTFGFCGANFSTAITAQNGALVNGIANTFRKAVTIGISFVMFPERNVFTMQKFMGTVVFFAGLVIKLLGKQGHESHAKHSHHAPAGLDAPPPYPSGGGHNPEQQIGLWDKMRRSVSLTSMPSLTLWTATESGARSEIDNGHGNVMAHNPLEMDPSSDTIDRRTNDSYPTTLTGLWEGVRDGIAGTLPASYQRQLHLRTKVPSADVENPGGDERNVLSVEQSPAYPSTSAGQHSLAHSPTRLQHHYLMVHGSISMPDLAYAGQEDGSQPAEHQHLR
jgi:hypothetical protein